MLLAAETANQRLVWILESHPKALKKITYRRQSFSQHPLLSSFVRIGRHEFATALEDIIQVINANQRLVDRLSFVLDGRHFAQRILLFEVPFRLLLQVDIDHFESEKSTI